MKRYIPLVFFVLAAPLCALQMPSVFSDSMVLQRETPVRIWGKATPGASIEVQFAGQTVSSNVDADGSWSVYLDPLVASFETQQMVVTNGREQLTFEDVLVGEVWLGAGQSNMGWEVRKSVDSDIISLGAQDPFLRLYKVNFNPSREMEFTSNKGWVKDEPTFVQYFSAVAYQFARDLRTTLNVPVGIIQSAVGGTPSIAWTRSLAIAKSPQLRAIEEEWELELAKYDESVAAWEQEYAEWRSSKGIEAENYSAHQRQGAPRQPEGPDSPRRPASLANGMISPIAGYTVRGAIWYQGEADTNVDPELYDERLSVMIGDWREWWGAPDMPFAIIQLPNFMKAQDRPANSNWAKLRESQRRVAQSDPNTGLAVTIDLGESNDIHPAAKRTVARRLARWALADVYGKIDLRGGPEIVSTVREGGSITLTFAQTGTGLHVHDAEQLSGFTASDSMEEPEIWWQTSFYAVPAEIISKNEVRLKIPDGKNPIRVRYAWQSNPIDASLSNKERLPAGPFEVELQ